MKNKKRKNSHGAVTVFLTIILVPCMVFTCAFGDVARVYLSRAQANSAADLSMYSLLSHYDEDLKEWYGLVASCQNIDSFYDETEKYFTGMMTASGIDGTASKLFKSYIAALKNGGDFSDFLQVEAAENITVTAADNSSLGSNPALIEDGIVEFMKYRGPVEIVANVYDRLNGLNLQKILDDAKKDEPIVEAKQEAAEAEGEVLQELLYTYIATANYQQYFVGQSSELGIPRKQELGLSTIQNQYPNQLDQIRDDYAQITDLITKFYVFTGLENCSGRIPNRSLPYVSGTGKDARVYYGSRTFTLATIGARETEKDSGIFEISGSSLSSILANVDSHISSVRNAGDDIANQLNGVAVPQWGHSGNNEIPNNDINQARYFAQVANVLISGNRIGTLSANADYMIADYCNIILALQCSLPESSDPGESWYSKLATAKSKIETACSQYLSYWDSTTQYEARMNEYVSSINNQTFDTFNAIASRLYTMPTTFRSDFSGGNNVTVGSGNSSYGSGGYYSGDANTARETIGAFQGRVKTVFGTLYKDLETEIKNLDVIINGGTTTWGGKEYTVVSLDTLKQKIIDYQTAREKWGKSAEGQETDFAKDEYAEYNHQTGDNDSEIAAAMMALTENDLEEFKTRMTNIKNLFQELYDALTTFTYGGKTVCTIEGRNELVTLGETVIPTDISSVKVHLSENSSDAQNYHSSLMSPLAGSVYDAPHADYNPRGNNPDIDEAITEFYRFMLENINLSELNQMTEAVDKNNAGKEKAKAMGDDATKEAGGMDEKYLFDLGKDPGFTAHSTGTFNAGTIITGLVGAVSKLIGGNFDEFRDELYVIEYAMDMFSYSAYNNTGEYKLAEKDGKEYTLADYDKNAEKPSFPEYVDVWISDKGVHTDNLNMLTKFSNQSLTNRPVNSTNNVSNLAEIEYLLYGKPTNEANLTSAYKDIFAIREALNLISGFQLFYSSSEPLSYLITSVAGLIQGATCGIVPIPVTKCLLIGLVATLESAHDMARLKAGVPVNLYKGKADQWFFAGGGVPSTNLSDFLDSLSSENITLEPRDENGIFYYEYLYLFMIMTASSGSYSSMLLRIGDLIEANMGAAGASGKGNGAYDLDNAKVFFKISGSLRVKPLLIALPMVQNMENVDTSSVLEKTDWCTYKIDTVRGYS